MTTTDIDFLNHPIAEYPLEQVAIRLHPRDDVAIAKVNLAQGQILRVFVTLRVSVRDLIPSGHKLALRDIAAGESIRRYGQVIGAATRPIAAGEHVHVHNLAVHDFEREADFGVDVAPVAYAPESERRTFMGHRRPGGRAGTRNYLAVIASVNCSAHTVREIAHHFTPERLASFPNVDGVIAFTHGLGCATRIGSADYVMLQRTLAGMARHPNVGAFVLVGLGCEVNQIADLARNYDLAPVGQAAGLPTSTGVEPEGQAGGLFYSGAKPTGQAGGLSYKGLVIQEKGGIRKTVMAGIAAVEALLPLVNASTREPLPISELMVALQCGGSDGWSGVTANPVLGLAADEIVRQGGSVVLAETPEIYGAEHLLIRRAISREVGEKLLHKVRWWEQHAARLNLEIDNNPAPGNKAGGLTTIYEKSLGAVAKAGGTPLMGVFDYAEPVTARGFSFMDTPGYDPVSVTGQAAGGCNLVVFTTGRGSVFGFKPAPSIKVSSNSITYQHMIDDMDVNAGRVLEGVPLQQVADELLDLIIAVASGQASKSEAQGVGEAEFDPWFLGGVL